jgi:hypothetical protein
MAARKSKDEMVVGSDEKPWTMSVPEAGKKYLGLSTNGSYEAAKRGEIPTINIGRLKRVPVRAMERMLDNVGTGASQ